MGRPFALTDDQVLDIQKRYQRSRHRGAIKDLMDRYDATRPTILAALRRTVKERSSDQQEQTSGTGCSCTEATQGLFSTCGHPVTCLCSLCSYHSRGLRCLVGERKVGLDVNNGQLFIFG